MKRVICLLGSVLLMVAGIFSFAAAQEPLHFTMAGFDGDNSSHDWDTNLFFVRMEERTGLTFSFDQHTDYDKWQAAKATMFDSGPLPDVLFKAELNLEEQLRYTESGQLIDLKPLLAEHAPHLWAVLEENPEYLQAVTLPNGKIGALPGIVELPAQNAMWINGEWLSQLRLEMPTDAESLLEVLRAFASKDPNQNGRKDEIPLSFFGVWDLKFLSHIFGVAVNDYNLYVDEEGAVCYFPAGEQFAEFLGFLRELYAEKLLDQNGFYMADAFRVSTDREQPATYGVFFAPNPVSIYPYEQAKQYVLLPPLAYNGRQVYREIGSAVVGGTFAITSACPDPAALLQWVDWLYTEEGAIETLAGVNEVDYAIDEEGRWEWIGGINQQSVDKLNTLSIYDTGNMPWRFPLAFYNRFMETEVERINNAIQSLLDISENPFAFISLAGEQRERIVSAQNELGKYVDECMARFVLGQWPLTDEQLAEFRQGLAERGVDAFVAEWQQIYEGR